MFRAWAHGLSDAYGPGRYCQFGMDALITIGCTRTWSGALIWAWMSWLSDTLGHDHGFGFGMDDFLIAGVEPGRY